MKCWSVYVRSCSIGSRSGEFMSSVVLLDPGLSGSSGRDLGLFWPVFLLLRSARQVMPLSTKYTPHFMMKVLLVIVHQWR